ncbi:unnamed protein product [Owenia fusiformis]|uniref:Uncharacterized protein n=1 Tax=Owenia fusiformis TaxID=6347 RepID=A0A8J1XMA4_OWEFU|nr:unnamed protein product [Owenia fusiformis]
MASETLAELIRGDYLKCKVCNSKFNKPILLPCLHTVCKACIGSYTQRETGTSEANSNIEKTPTDNDSISDEAHVIECPICATEIETDKTGDILKLDNPFMTNLLDLAWCNEPNDKECDYCAYENATSTATHRCLDCRDSMCDDCTGAHKRTKLTRRHKVAPYEQIYESRYDFDIRDLQHLNCSTHPKELIILFCKRCERLVCQKCQVKDHNQHELHSIPDIIPHYQEHARTLLQRLQEKMPTIQDYTKFLQDYNANLQQLKEQVIDKVETQAELLHQLIDDEKRDMIGDIKEMCTEEQLQVMSKAEALEKNMKAMKDSEDVVEKIFQHGRHDELLAVHKWMTNRLSQLIYQQLDGISKKINLFFKEGSATKLNIKIMFGSIEKFDIPMGKVASLGSPRTGLASLMTSVLPSIAPEPELVLEFEARSLNDTKDIWPTGLAISRKNEFIILDHKNKTVKLFDDKGKFKFEFGTSEKHPFKEPYDVTILYNDNIAVTDYECEDVKIFTATGAHVKTIDGVFKYPRGITCNNEGELLIVDSEKHKLTILDPESGKVIKTIQGKDDDGCDYFTDAYYITTNINDIVIVTDWAAPNIKRWSIHDQIWHIRHQR